MLFYILSKHDLIKKDLIESAKAEFEFNIELNGKSRIEFPKRPNGERGDFIFCPNQKFIGIIDSVEEQRDNTSCIVHTFSIHSLFDRKVILSNEHLISGTGIEDFVARTIQDNFITSYDPLINMPHINVTATTHTPVYAAVSTENGIYNLRTYLGNIKERYDIFLDYEFTDTNLNITVRKDTTPMLNIETNAIVDYTEVYSVDVIAKVQVLVLHNNHVQTYYLRNDRTTTTDVNDPNRVSGTIEVVSVQEADEAQQAALDAFKSNSYKHNLELKITKDNQLYKEDDFFVGRKLKVKTNTGIYETFVSKIHKQTDNDIYTVTCGNMPITLIDRMRRG